MHLQLFWGKKGEKKEKQSKKSVKERKIGWVEKKGRRRRVLCTLGVFFKAVQT